MNNTQRHFKTKGLRSARGMIHGKGTTTSDSVPVNLSRGEAVLPAETVQKIGGPQTVQHLIKHTTGTTPRRSLAAGAHFATGYSGQITLPDGELNPNAPQNSANNPSPQRPAPPMTFPQTPATPPAPASTLAATNNMPQGNSSVPWEPNDNFRAPIEKTVAGAGLERPFTPHAAPVTQGGMSLTPKDVIEMPKPVVEPAPAFSRALPNPIAVQTPNMAGINDALIETQAKGLERAAMARPVVPENANNVMELFKKPPTPVGVTAAALPHTGTPNNGAFIPPEPLVNPPEAAPAKIGSQVGAQRTPQVAPTILQPQPNATTPAATTVANTAAEVAPKQTLMAKVGSALSGAKDTAGRIIDAGRGKAVPATDVAPTVATTTTAPTAAAPKLTTLQQANNLANESATLADVRNGIREASDAVGGATKAAGKYAGTLAAGAATLLNNKAVKTPLSLLSAYNAVKDAANSKSVSDAVQAGMDGVQAVLPWVKNTAIGAGGTLIGAADLATRATTARMGVDSNTGHGMGLAQVIGDTLNNFTNGGKIADYKTIRNLRQDPEMQQIRASIEAARGQTPTAQNQAAAAAVTPVTQPPTPAPTPAPAVSDEQVRTGLRDRSIIGTAPDGGGYMTNSKGVVTRFGSAKPATQTPQGVTPQGVTPQGATPQGATPKDNWSRQAQLAADYASAIRHGDMGSYAATRMLLKNAPHMDSNNAAREGHAATLKAATANREWERQWKTTERDDKLHTDLSKQLEAYHQTPVLKDGKPTGDTKVDGEKVARHLAFLQSKLGDGYTDFLRANGAQRQGMMNDTRQQFEVLENANKYAKEQGDAGMVTDDIDGMEQGSASGNFSGTIMGKGSADAYNAAMSKLGWGYNRDHQLIALNRGGKVQYVPSYVLFGGKDGDTTDTGRMAAFNKINAQMLARRQAAKNAKVTEGATK